MSLARPSWQLIRPGDGVTLLTATGERIRAVATSRPYTGRAMWLVRVSAPDHGLVDHPWPAEAVERGGPA